MDGNGKGITIRNGNIVTPWGVVRGNLCTRNGVISYVGAPSGEPPSNGTLDAEGKYVLPGLIDIHMHGGGGFDLASGVFDAERKAFDDSETAFFEGVSALARSLAASGTTRAVLGTVAAPVDGLATSLSRLGEYISSPRDDTEGAAIHGSLLEGTFIKASDYAGAQNPEYFHEPSVELFDRLNGAAKGTVRIVNVVPEHGDSALRLIDALCERGVVPAAGHTASPADLYLRAVDHGLKLAIHFTNGPTGSSLKTFRRGGVLQAVLQSRKVYAELICDGYHVNPAYILDIIKRKGHEHICVITDAMFPTDAEGITDFEVAGIRGAASENGQFLRCLDAPPDTLFGSVLRMDVAFANVLSWLTTRYHGIWNEEHLPIDLDEALVMTSAMCSGNPAHVLGVYDPPSKSLNQDLSGYVGSLEVGKRADIVVADVVGSAGAYHLKIEDVLVGGRPQRLDE